MPPADSDRKKDRYAEISAVRNKKNRTVFLYMLMCVRETVFFA